MESSLPLAGFEDSAKKHGCTRVELGKIASMSEPQFEPVKLPRPGTPDLGISFLKPQGWQTVQIPDEPPQFSEPGYFHPLAIIMAPFGAVLFTAAARPAFEDGSVQQWTQFLCGENKIDIESGSNTALCGMQGCLVEGSQPSDMGKLRMRLFFFEDGMRLFQLGIIAPEAIWPSVETSLDMMQRSFRLEQKLGQSSPIAPPPEEKPPKVSEVAESEPYDPPPQQDEPSEQDAPADSKRTKKAQRKAAIQDAQQKSEELAANEHVSKSERKAQRKAAIQGDRAEWKQRVDELESQGKIEEAESLLLDSIDHLGVYSSMAYLWEKEAARRLQAGDSAGARAAAERAETLLYQYAGSATSGGEGAALSLERDQRLSALKGLLGK